MSFANGGASSFTSVSIQRNAPQCSGVYGLTNAKEWLLIGEGSDIRAMLLEHLRESNTDLRTQNPAGFTFEECAPEDRVARQAALIRELKPRCNTSNGVRSTGGPQERPRRFNRM